MICVLQLTTAVSDTSIDYMSDNAEAKDQISSPPEATKQPQQSAQPQTWQPKSMR